jgi:hypothetical protein
LLWDWRHRRHRRQRDAQTVEAAWDHGMRIHPKISQQQDAALRAEQLLQRLLTSEQLDHYREFNRVRVQTALATYYVAAGQLIRAERDGGEFALCIQFAHPADSAWLPAQDLMIAQLLLIRTDEDGVWKRFGPAGYRERAAPLRGGAIFGRVELLTALITSTVMFAGAPVQFTEDLEPIGFRLAGRLRAVGPSPAIPNLSFEINALLEGNDVEP